MKIGLEEWLAALSSANQPSEDARTISGWAEALGVGRQKAAGWVAAGLENGWMERATIIVTELNGRQRRGIGFRLTKEET